MQHNQQKVFITGADGYLGHALSRSFRAAGWVVLESGLASSKRDDYFYLDITNKNLVEEVICNTSPDLVVHTAGISSLQECEANKATAYKTNVVGTSNIIEAVLCCKSNPKLVFLSSDYVFEGNSGSYIESSERLPKTFYGETKRQSEDDILARVENHLIVRTSNVYGGGGKFFMFLMDNLKRGNSVELYTNTFYTPTFWTILQALFFRFYEKMCRELSMLRARLVSPDTNLVSSPAKRYTQIQTLFLNANNLIRD